MPKIKVKELEELQEFLERKLNELSKASKNPSNEFNKHKMCKLIHDLGNLVEIANASNLSEMPMLNTAARNMYQNIKYLATNLLYNDTIILKFLNNSEFSTIKAVEQENFDSGLEYTSSEQLSLNKRKVVGDKEEEEINWDIEETENAFKPK
ncbi:TPA: hypothetical protein JBI80_13805 [Legionella pneumophila]|nr:hypothetical protein [Legionella pneumophila]